MSIGTFAANLGFHLSRSRMVLSGDIGFFLGLGLHLFLFRTVRGHLLKHDAFGENIFSVHMLFLFLVGVVKLKIIVKLVLEVVHLIDVFILNGDVIILPHGTEFVMQFVHILGTVHQAVPAEL